MSESFNKFANEDSILSFAFHEGLLFTNNQAEIDIRTVNTKQNVSACFRTVARENHYARIQGLISTIRKQNQNSFQSSKSVLENNFNGQLPNNYKIALETIKTNVATAC